jgi:hypothetical protein
MRQGYRLLAIFFYESRLLTIHHTTIYQVFSSLKVVLCFMRICLVSCVYVKNSHIRKIMQKTLIAIIDIRMCVSHVSIC